MIYFGGWKEMMKIEILAIVWAFCMAIILASYILCGWGRPGRPFYYEWWKRGVYSIGAWVVSLYWVGPLYLFFGLDVKLFSTTTYYSNGCRVTIILYILYLYYIRWQPSLLKRNLMTNQYDTLIVLGLMIIVIWIFSYIRAKGR